MRPPSPKPSARRLLAWVAGRYLLLTLRSTRWTTAGGQHLGPYLGGGGVIVALWHERLALAPALWLRARRDNPQRRVAALASRHRDGRLIAGVLAVFGVRAVHGSSGRARLGGRRDHGGAAGLRGLAAALAGGEAVVITPDGPRGPRRVAAPGTAQLAALSAAPVVAVSAQVGWRITLGSWDRMVLPLPFGRGVLVCQPAITVPAGSASSGAPLIAAAMSRAADRADALYAASGMLSGKGGPVGAAWAAAATLAIPALMMMLRRRAAHGKEMRGRLAERRGHADIARPAGKLLWLHAASVGETVSALPILAALPAGLHVLFTTGTRTSATLLAARLADRPCGCQVRHRFVPLDVPAWAARFLDHWQPDAACFLESELWPNLLAACRARAIPAALVNARLSARSAAGWARAGGWAGVVLGSFAWIAAQSAADAVRLRTLGARAVDAPGNLKLAASPLPASPAELAQLAGQLGGRPRWLAASTHPADDAVIVAAHRVLAARHPGLLTAIVPRHPERGAALAQSVGAQLRSRAADPPAGGLWVVDTLGELGLFYRCFPIVMMGKSFATNGTAGGGQNPWEPAQLGCAVACGPDMDNFPEAAARLRGADALATMADAAELAAWVDALLRDPARLGATGAAARRATASQGDLPAELAARLLALMDVTG